jgi:uncharacterized protein (TIGR02271 family)
MISTSDLTRVTGSTVLDKDGSSIGTAREVYVDDATGEPEWVTVHTGLFGTSESFIPLSQATLAEDGLRVPYDKRTVKDAPSVGSDGHLTPEEEDELYRYYGVPGVGRADVAGGGHDHLDTAAATGISTGTPAGTSTGTPAGTDVSGPTTDDAMTRSEERLTVRTERHVTGRARLRKFVTTEIVTVDVPVRREEVRLVNEPLEGAAPGADAGEPYDGPPLDLGDGERVMVLHEERPVVTTETVPVERVRLSTETVTETRAVSGEVRTEHIEVDGDVDGQVDGQVDSQGDSDVDGETRGV